jgi:hypothetical protein
MSLEQGLAKAWSHYSGTGTTFNNSLNLSSAVDNTTGDYSANFSSSFSDAYYSATNGSAESTSGRGTFLTGFDFSHTTSLYRHQYGLSSNANGSGLIDSDINNVQITVHGDLA